MNPDSYFAARQQEDASLLDALYRILLAVINGALDVAKAGPLRFQVQLLEHVRREEQDLPPRFPEGARWPAHVYVSSTSTSSPCCTMQSKR